VPESASNVSLVSSTKYAGGLSALTGAPMPAIMINAVMKPMAARDMTRLEIEKNWECDMLSSLPACWSRGGVVARMLGMHVVNVNATHPSHSPRAPKSDNLSPSSSLHYSRRFNGWSGFSS
jgi:hypothetical protein